MQFWNNRFSRFWRPINSRKNAARANKLRSSSPIKVLTYRGYGRLNKVFLHGRVIKDKFINVNPSDSKWRNFVNTFKRFRSYEIPGAQLEVKIHQQRFELTTDSEGYFTLDRSIEPKLPSPEAIWQPAKIQLHRIPGQELEVKTTAHFLVPHQPAFGVISDIDDTILKTEVTSLLKLRAVYLTILKNAGSRIAFQQVNAFYQALKQGPEGNADNPCFYVSNSPWNLYDLLEDFIELNHLPTGPILLRDFGVTPDKMPQDYLGHKHFNICKILKTYPDFPFILIGDSGEKDADIYLSVAKQFPGRISAIYIRDVRSHRRAERIRQLIESATGVNIHLFRNFREAAELAIQNNLINPEIFENFKQR